MCALGLGPCCVLCGVSNCTTGVFGDWLWSRPRPFTTLVCYECIRATGNARAGLSAVYSHAQASAEAVAAVQAAAPQHFATTRWP